MKNKGFSLVELIVVVAIMGVAMAVGGYALSAITLANAKSCANKINAALEQTRTQSYSSDNGEEVAKVTFYIENTTKNVMMKKSYEAAPEKLAGPNMKVEYKASENSPYDEIEDSTGITFEFDRRTGGFKSPYTSIRVTGGGKTYIITCYLLTGKTKIE